MTKSRSQELSEKAAAERRRCRDWLLPFMQDNQPKFLTKDELRVAAIRQLNVSKNSFDFAWIDAIETTGRHDWYEPLRRRPQRSDRFSPPWRAQWLPFRGKRQINCALGGSDSIISPNSLPRTFPSSL
jgi:hypothetical protein